MPTRIPHTDNPTEVRQAFQHLTLQSAVLTTGVSGYILVAQGVNVAPVWQTIASTIDHGSIGGLGDDDHTQYHNDTRGDVRYYTKAEHLNFSAGAGDAGKPIKLDANGHLDATMLNDADVDHGSIGGLGDDDHTIYLLADGTRALAGNWSLGSNDLTSVGLYGGVNVPTMNTFFSGTFQETFDALVTSDGATITLTLQQSPTGDLTMQFSDGYTTLDCTSPAQTIALTAGVDDTSPQSNYIYIPQSTKVLTKSTSSWPAGEHIRVAYCLVPSAAFVQSNGCYINQNCNDHLAGTDSQGHMSHMTAKLRRLGATWFSGVNANGATASYFTIGAGTVDWLSTSGEIDQLHEHTFPAVETSGSDIVLVVNQNGTAYDDIADLFLITDDSTGTTIANNRYFNLVFWGVVNKSGEFAALMVNLPGGFYTKQSDALVDSSGYDVYDIPREFSIDSGTAFLICRATFQMGATWAHVSTVDLRGLTPATASGSSVNDHGGLGGLTDVADHPGYLLVDGSRSLTGNWSIDAGITIDGRDLSVDGTKLDTIETNADVTDATNVAIAGAAMSGGAFHDGFSDSVANEHIDHSGVSITAGNALTGGGDITTTRTIALSHLGIESLVNPGGDYIMFWDNGEAACKWLQASTGLTLSGTTLTSNDSAIVHDNLSGYNGNQHIDWTNASANFSTTGTLTISPNGHTILFRDTTPGGFLGRLTIQAQITGANNGLFLDLHSYDGNGTQDMGVTIWAVGDPDDWTNYEVLEFRWDASESEFAFDTLAAGSGTIRPLNFYTSGHRNQLVLVTDGSVTMGGALAVTGNITGPNVSSGADPGHTHTDQKVKVDSGATADYIGATSGTGVLRVDAPLKYQDGGNYVTLGIDQTDYIPSMTNGNAGSIVICQVVYCDGNDSVDLARADADATSEVIGLVAATSIASSANGIIRTEGIFVATTGQWDNVTGDSGGLTAGSVYYLNDVTAGALTTTEPTTPGSNSVRVGIGLSTTEMKLLISTIVAGEPGASPLITSNLTLYVTMTGNDGTGVGTSGSPWLTLNKALDWLSDKLIAAGVIITIDIDDGTYAWTSTDIIEHINGDKINIVGQNTYSLSMTSVQSSSGSAGAWSIILNVDDVSNASVDDFLLIPAAVSGGTALYTLPGCWIITNVDVGNTRLTITSTNRHTAAPSGAVSATVILIKTMLQYTGCDGIEIVANGKLGLIDKLVIKGGSAANNGISVKGQGICQGGTSLGVWNFSLNVFVQSGGHFEGDYLISSNGAYGIRIYYATARAVSGVFSGCSNVGISCDTADAILNNILSTGNVNHGVNAEASCNLAPVSARVHYNDIGVAASYCSFVNAAGAAINTNVTTQANPAVNTEGNILSYIRN